jgi:hypothetical protein
MQYPYANSVSGLKAVINQLRSAFPAKVGSDTLKKWSIAPNNEAYVLGVIRFLGLVDDEGKKVAEVAKIFAASDADFKDRFAALVKDAYKGLFEQWGDPSWTLEEGKLIPFFREEDSSSALVGKRQAQTFRALAELAGKADAKVGETKTAKQKDSTKVPKAASARPSMPAAKKVVDAPPGATFGTTPQLTVRIEINLPVADDQAVYDRIFKSLREHLVNG